MKFEEFRRLVEKRCMLVDLKESETDEFMKAEYEMQVEETEEELFKESGFGAPKLYRIFFVGGEVIKDFLKKFFKGKNENIKVDYMGYMLDLELIIDNKYYNLGSYDKNQSLLCLYAKANPGWEQLLKDYPDLKEFLWHEFQDLKTVRQRNEISLVQRMLLSVQGEIDFLTSPEKRAEKVRDLRLQEKDLKNQLSNLEESANDFIF